MQNILEQSKNKTRVLVLSSQPSVTQLLLEVLRFHEKDFDFYLEDGSFKNSDTDFVILETSNLAEATSFEPNIALITSEISSKDVISVIEKITPGGVLVYHSNLSELVEESSNFFRKLEFSGTAFSKTDLKFTLQTNLGDIPISSSDENLIQNIEGIKLLSQQFGVMEEDFYEPVMSFE